MIVDAIRDNALRWAEWMFETVGLPVDIQRLLLMILLILVIPWLFRRVLMYGVGRRTEDAHVLYNWRKGSEYAAIVLTAFLAWRLLFASASTSGSWTTYLGLLSAGLAISLQDPIANLIGWLFVITRRPFEVGDRIEIDSYAGDVVDIRFFQFTLLEIGGWVDAEQSTGRVLHIPNKLVFTHAVASYTRGFPYIWVELPVLLTFESDWQKAKTVLQRLANEQAIKPAKQRVREKAGRYGISYANMTPTVYTKAESHGVELTVRFLCEPRQRRIAMENMWEAILLAFQDDDTIDYAYPTQRIYIRPNEHP